FDTADLDQTLNSLLPVATQKTSQPARANYINHANDNPDLKEFRIRRMLDFISPSSLTYDEWLAVGIALFNEGFDCGVWEQWSRADNRFKDGECEAKWKTFHYDATGNKIGTLYQYAVEGGYDEKETQRDFYQSHPELSNETRADDNLNVVRRHEELLAKLKELQNELKELQKPPMSKDKISKSKDKISKIRGILHKLCHWAHDKNGNPTKIKPDVYNYKLIFDNDPNLKNLFGRDDFRQETIFLRRAAWHNKDAPLKDSWDDADDAELRLYLAENYAEMSNPQRTFDFIIRVARENSFHSIKKFFDGLPKWDGVPRMKKLFVKFLGADDTEYTHEVTRHALLGAIARAFYPGCDFQSVVVLQGPQGIGKSRVIRMLGGKHGVNKGENWHVALRDQLDDSHAVDAMRKGWIVEIEEFAAGSRADVNAMKGVLSADDVTRRFAYDRRAKTIKAHWTFFATCNDDAPLRDQTGNRRFLPIKCHNKTSQIVDGMTADYIQQVWAEALVEFKELFPTVDDFDDDKLRLSPEIQAQAAAQAENITQDDGMTTEIKGYLNTKILPLFLWFLLTREERRDFIKNGRLVMLDAVSEFNHRRRARGGNPDTVQCDVDKISDWLDGVQGKDFVRTNEIKRGDNTVDEYILYGSELREHICPAEIFNECFGSDKRKHINRINEILSMLDGWHLGERLQKADPAYPDQKKVYYRDKDNCPVEESNKTAPAQSTPPTFDPDDMPF
ncbi:MAG: PriCT-2 domain-containing protein, partial [Selenomonadaceae bacterium]|nr:PriCT-2 domain-containing protein [Selenomonadaceae bacterium]